MIMYRKKEKAVISKFKSLLRCGMDYSVDHMYSEAGKKAFITGASARTIINRHYREQVTQEMINCVKEINCTDRVTTKEKRIFSNRFNVCMREATLLIRYIKRRKNEK